jgi:hypothetical protein
MKAAAISCTLLLLLGLTVTRPLLAVDTYVVNWPALETAFLAYLQSPGLHAAERVVALLPAGRRVSREGRDFDGRAAERLWRYSLDLAPLVWRAHPGALDVAWALRAIADGLFTQDLNAMIGKALARHPRAFLVALKRNRSRPDDADACAVADSLGVDLVDNPSAQRAEVQARIAALESVTDPALQSERDCVLTSLRAIPAP